MQRLVQDAVLALYARMTLTATQFQLVLDVMKQWYSKCFFDLLVDGRPALTYETHYIFVDEVAFPVSAFIDESFVGIRVMGDTVGWSRVASITDNTDSDAPASSASMLASIEHCTPDDSWQRS